MKKIKILFVLIAFFNLFSCTKEELNKEIINSDVLSDNPNLKAAVSATYNVLGWGINPTNGYLEPESFSVNRVIDVDKLVLEQPDLFVEIPINATNSALTAGGNVSEYSLELNKKFKGSVTYKLVTADIMLDVSTKRSISSKWSYVTFNQIKHLKKMYLQHSTATLINYTTTQFKSDIATLTPDVIIARYGTHVYTNITVGGKLQANYKANVTSTNKKASVTGGVNVAMSKAFNLGSSTSADIAYSNENFDATFHCYTRGGDRSIGLEVNLDPKAPISKVTELNAWNASVNLSNAVIVDIGDGSLIPIYELVADVNKANALRSAVLQFLAANNINQVDGNITCGFPLNGNMDKIISLDYNGDNIQDILCYSPGNQRVFLNGGFKNGTFENIAAYANGLGTYDFKGPTDQVIALDFNGDNKDDLMCYRPGSGYVYLLQSIGDGSFTKIYGGTGIGGFNFSDLYDRAIALDYNKDNKIDIMCYRPGKKIVFLLQGNGNGTFTNVSQSFNGIASYDFSHPFDRAVALDYDNDGDDDLLTYRPGSKIVFFARSNGNGTFTNVSQSFNGIGSYNLDSPNDLAIALDYNGDGRDDLMFYRPGSGYVYLFRNNGTANFGFAQVFGQTGIAGYNMLDNRARIIPLDYDNDNLGDIIIYIPGTGVTYSASGRPTNMALYVRDYPY